MKEIDRDNFALTREELSDMVTFWDEVMPLVKIAGMDKFPEAMPIWIERFEKADKLLLKYMDEMEDRTSDT